MHNFIGLIPIALIGAYIFISFRAVGHILQRGEDWRSRLRSIAALGPGGLLKHGGRALLLIVAGLVILPLAIRPTGSTWTTEQPRLARWLTRSTVGSFASCRCPGVPPLSLYMPYRLMQEVVAKTSTPVTAATLKNWWSSTLAWLALTILGNATGTSETTTPQALVSEGAYVLSIAVGLVAVFLTIQLIHAVDTKELALSRRRMG